MTYASLETFLMPALQCASCAGSHVQGQSSGFGLQGPKVCACKCHEAQLPKGGLKRILNQNERYRILESGYFADAAKSYFSGEGKMLDDYLRGKGRDSYCLEGVGDADLGDAVAAALIDGDKVCIVGDYRFERKLEEFAKEYDVPKEWAKRYVLDHENMHRWQRGIDLRSEWQAERDVEGTLMEYYGNLMGTGANVAMYRALHNIAQNRFDSVERNYAGRMYDSVPIAA